MNIIVMVDVGRILRFVDISPYVRLRDILLSTTR